MANSKALKIFARNSKKYHQKNKHLFKMERHVLLKLRIATALDFSDEKGNKRHGVAYFLKNNSNQIEQKIYYFNENTCVATFKELYANAQVYVIHNPGEIVSTFNCIDWGLVSQELDYELSQPNLLTP